MALLSGASEEWVEIMYDLVGLLLLKVMTVLPRVSSQWKLRGEELWLS